MSQVYRCGSLYETVYYNTSKEAMRYRAGGDELPESVERLDAAEECNRLIHEIESSDAKYDAVRLLLQELYDVCSPDTYSSRVGVRVGKFIEEHPMAAVTNCDREGGRSYGI